MPREINDPDPSEDRYEFEKVRSFIMKALIILSLICACFGGCSYLNNKVGFENDNVIEELIEDQIEKATGLDIDLTPFDD